MMEGYFLCKKSQNAPVERIDFATIPDMLDLLNHLRKRSVKEDVLCCFDAKEKGFVAIGIGDYGTLYYFDPKDFKGVDNPEVGLEGDGWSDTSVELVIKDQAFELVHTAMQRFPDLIAALEYGHKVATSFTGDGLQFLVSTIMYDDIDFTEFLSRNRDYEYQLEP